MDWFSTQSYPFDACKKKHVPLSFITLVVWGSGMKKMKISDIKLNS